MLDYRDRSYLLQNELDYGNYKKYKMSLTDDLELYARVLGGAPLKVNSAAVLALVLLLDVLDVKARRVLGRLKVGSVLQVLRHPLRRFF